MSDATTRLASFGDLDKLLDARHYPADFWACVHAADSERDRLGDREEPRMISWPNGTPLNPRGMLETRMDALSGHLRAFGEPGLAAAIEGAKDGDPERLPQRVLALFTHGMGGLLDVPLYVDGVLDREATYRRDTLADELHNAAVAHLG